MKTINNQSSRFVVFCFRIGKQCKKKNYFRFTTTLTHKLPNLNCVFPEKKEEVDTGHAKFPDVTHWNFVEESNSRPAPGSVG
jgi:hypothetical protein